MNTSALILMVCTHATVIGLTAFFFYRVLTAKPRPEPDSYAENDDDPR
jgi:hypothetical protein